MLGWIIHKYCLFVYKTSKVRFVNGCVLDKYVDTPIILASWHGRLFFSPFFNRQKIDVYSIISVHKDGVLAARVMGLFGIKQIRGSSNRSASHKKGAKDRGGTQVIRKSIRLLRNGNSIAITPDGPKGPRMHVQDGVVGIASMSGAEIIPITFSSSRSIIFKSWDRFMLPLPFGVVAMVVGDPISVQKDVDDKMMENAGKEIENQLNSITRLADKRVGIIPIEPTCT